MAALGAGSRRSASTRRRALYRRVVEHQPLAEELARRLMACLLALGQRAEALRPTGAAASSFRWCSAFARAAETEALVASLRNL